MIVHKLTDEDLHLAKDIMRERRGHKIDEEVMSNKIDDSQTEEEVDLRGAMGEVAVANVFDMTLNREVSASGDSGWDARKGALYAEVKTRQGKHKDFAMVDDKTDLQADLGILCWQKKRDVIIAGWITHAEWIMMSETLMFGSWERKGVKFQNMREPESLYKMI